MDLKVNDSIGRDMSTNVENVEDDIAKMKHDVFHAIQFVQSVPENISKRVSVVSSLMAWIKNAKSLQDIRIKKELQNQEIIAQQNKEINYLHKVIADMQIDNDIMKDNEYKLKKALENTLNRRDALSQSLNELQQNYDKLNSDYQIKTKNTSSNDLKAEREANQKMVLSYRHLIFAFDRVMEWVHKNGSIIPLDDEQDKVVRIYSASRALLSPLDPSPAKDVTIDSGVDGNLSKVFGS